jgi:hypothetical protein
MEQHFLWRAAPVYYAAGWLLVVGFAVALIRGDSPNVGEVAAFASFVALWVVNGLVLRGDRRVELGDRSARES